MKTRFIFLIVAAMLCSATACCQPKIIFDTDFGGDADDLGALAMLHHFTDRGECKLLAVMCWSTEEYAVPAIDAVNRFYHHPAVPIGVRKGSTHFSGWSYSKPIADSFYHNTVNSTAADAVLLYRQLLAAAEDHSIVIVTTGPLVNIQLLIKSVADSFSTLTGKELLTKKVKEFVIMGGQFPEGKEEWNFNGEMPGVTQFVLKNISVPITFSGFEIGVLIKTGKSFNSIDHHSPLYIGAMYFSQHAPWIKTQFKDSILDNSTYDQTAVLYAVRNGVGTYWSRIEGGYCEADEHGGNKWIPGPESNQSYLKLKMQPQEIALLIDSVMLNKF